MSTDEWSQWQHLRLTPGGALTPDGVVGRDDLAAEVAALLRTQSVVLVAERRSGKTSLLTLLEVRPPTGMQVVKLSVEGVESPEEFVRRLIVAAQPHLKQKRFTGLVALLDELGITGVGGVTREVRHRADWKPVLEETLEQIAAAGQVVVVLDELPYVIDRIGQTTGDGEARAVLDLLRNARQTHPTTLRFVYCGSIGFHHVLKSRRGGSWSPINDMRAIDVGPISTDSARALAGALLRNEAIPCADVDAVTAAVIEVCENVPFFIQSVIADTKTCGRTPITPDIVRQLFDEALNRPNDPLVIGHLETRIRDYYGADADLAATLLDVVAEAPPEGIKFSELLKVASSKVLAVPEPLVRELLVLLGKDHYLVREGGVFRFRLQVIRRAWRRLRYLD